MFALIVRFVLPVSAETIDPNMNYTYIHFKNGLLFGLPFWR